MKIINVVLLLFLSLNHVNGYAQLWNKQFDNGGNEFANSIAILNNNIFLSEINDNNATIIKTDLDGNILTAKSLNNILRGSTIINTTNNELIYLGTSKTSEENIVVIKLDENLNITWSTQINFPEFQFAEAGIENSNGDFTICGYTASSSTSTGSRDGIVARINKNGQLLWFKKYAVGSADYFSGLAEGEAGNIVLTGAILGGAGMMDISITKIDNQGDVLSSYTWGGDQNDGGYSVIYLNNEYYISGNTWSAGVGMQDMVLLKLDNTLNLIYSKTFGGTNIEPGIYLNKTQNGKLLLAGQTNSIPGKEKDLCLLTLEQDGSIIKMKNIGTTRNEDVGYGYQFIKEYNNAFYVSSSTTDMSNNKNILLSKVDMIRNDECCDLVRDLNFLSTTSNIPLINNNFTIDALTSFSVFNVNTSTSSYSNELVCKSNLSLNTSIIINSTNNCVNSPLFFNSSLTSPGLTYLWNFGDPASGVNNSSTNENPTHTFNAVGNYTVQLIISDGCASDTDTMVVDIKDGININTQLMSSTPVICQNDTAKFTSLSNDPTAKFIWNFNDPSSGSNNFSNLQNPVHVFNQPGQYNVLLISSNECYTDSDRISINVTGNIPANFNYDVDTCLGIVKLTTNLASNITSHWFLDDELISTENNPSLTLENEGNYTIKLITNPNSNCADTLEQVINYFNDKSLLGIQIPNVFTPNNDGINDFYELSGNANCKIKKMIIFNRWGKKIMESTNNIRWDGKNNNLDSPEGTYILYLEYNNNTIVKTIHLIR